MVSVVIPMYNAEKTITRCIESVLCSKTEAEEYEVILVDDGSSDHTAEICKKYVEIYTNVFYFYQDNKGVSSARNLGILKSVGEWIIFVDADDIIEKCFLPLAEKKIKTKSDLYIFGRQNGEKVTDFADNTIISFNDKVKLIEAMCLVKTEYNMQMPGIAALHAKIYARDVLLQCGLCFDERLSFAEDLLFNTRFVLEARRIECINQIVYKYIENTTSITHTYRSTDLLHDDYFLMELNKTEKEIPELKRAYEYSLLNAVLVLLNRDFGNRKNRKKMKARINDFKTLQKQVRPYPEEDILAIYKRRKKLFVLRKRIILYMVAHHWNYLVLWIYKIMK